MVLRIHGSLLYCLQSSHGRAEKVLPSNGRVHGELLYTRDCLATFDTNRYQCENLGQRQSLPTSISFEILGQNIGVLPDFAKVNSLSALREEEKSIETLEEHC
jgi:hypothetical protein